MYQSFLQAYAIAKKWDSPDKYIVRDRAYSGGDVDALANYYAKQIRNHFEGNCAGQRVCTLMPHGLDLLALILAIFKCQSVWVPMDTTRTPSFTGELLQSADVNLILGEEDYFPVQLGQKYISVSLLKTGFEEGVEYNFKSLSCQESNPAYIIHTSGTTGLPKGVEVSHKALMNYLIWAKEQYVRGLSERIAVFSPPWVDLGITALLLPLVTNLKATLFPNGSIEAWLNAIANDVSVEVVKCTPSHLEIVKDLNLSIAHWKQLIVGGEELKPSLVEWLFLKNDKILIYNEYGPTECTVGCLCALITDFNKERQIEIGKPISGVEVALNNVELVEGGKQGELRVFGECLANGYLGKQGEGGFGVDPLRGRYYDTGDVIFEDHFSHKMYFINRVDRQVKINGYRVELKGVESHFEHLPFVANCTVDLNQENGLVAYIQGELTAANLASLFEHSRLLSTITRPKEFRKIEGIALLDNGKVDFEKTKASSSVIQIETGAAPPADLEGIWSLILGNVSFDKSDNFFELGGSSIHLPLIKSLVRQVYHVNIGLGDLLKNTRFDELLKFIQRRERLLECEKREIERSSYPLQQLSGLRLWKAWRINPLDTEHNCSVVFSVDRVMVKVGLVEAVNALLDKIKVLRRNIQFVHGRFIEIINNGQVTPQLTRDDLFLYYAKYQLPFDIVNDLAFRCFYSVKEDHYQFMFDIHHSNSDGLSNKLIVQKFIQIVQGDSIESPLDSDQYYYKTENLTAESYWIDHFKTISVCSRLPRYSVQSKYKRKKNAIQISFDQEATNRVKANAALLEVTPSQFMFAVFSLSIMKLFNLNDLVVTVFSSGRFTWSDFLSTGAYVNPLPIGVVNDENATIAERLKSSMKVLKNCLDNQEVSFERLMEINQENSDTDLLDKMKVSFLYQSKALFDIQEPGLKQYDLPYSKLESFPLSLEVKECENFQINFAFDREFSTDNAECVVHSFQSILLDYVDHRNKKLSEFKLELKKSKPPSSTNKVEIPLLQLYNFKALHSRNDVAIKDQHHQLTYGELWEWSSTVAKTLRLHQAENEMIALHLPNSIELLVGILGIWKAGGVYLPVDQSLPLARKEYILENSKAKIILGTSGVGAFPFINFPLATENCDADAVPLREIGLRDNVYLLYTSGSTGLPKGVPVTQSNLIHALHAFQKKLDLKRDDCIYHKTSIGFDVSLFELLLPVYSGAAVYVGRETKDPREIVQDISESGSTVVSQTPSMFSHILSYLQRSDFPLKSVRLLVLAGESFTLNLLNRIKRNMNDGLKVYNFYGPTEATIACSVFECSEQDIDWEDVPIGKPIDNVSFLVVSENDEKLPDGLLGELCVGGETIVNNYWNNEELDEQKFIHFDGKRYYKTGDQVQVCSKGYYWFRGRNDDQIKLNGFRIELGEIRSKLELVPGTEEAVVVVRSHEIVAFFRSSNGLSEESALEELKKQLPHYMLPSRCILWADEFPKNHNGKVVVKHFEEHAFNLPKKTIEPPSRIVRVVMKAASKALKKDGLSWEKDFFSVGGTSLTSIVFAYELSRLFGYDFKLETIYKERSFRNIASFIERAEKDNDDFVPYFHFGRSSEVWFAFPPAFGSGLLFERLYPHLEEVSICSFSFDHKKNLLSRYVEKILQLQVTGNITLIGYSGGGNIAFEVAKLLELEGRKVEKIIMLDSWRKRRYIPSISGDLVESRTFVLDYLKKEFNDYNEIMKNHEELLFAYYHFLNIELQDFSGSVQADIINLVCDGKEFLKIKDHQEELLLTDWQSATSGNYLEFQVGFGHFDFFDEHIQQTASLIKQVS